MNLPTSIVSTLVIGAVIWAVLLAQKADSPNEQQKYASAGYSEEDLEYVAWESIKAPTSSTKNLNLTPDPQVNEAKAMLKTERPSVSEPKARRTIASPQPPTSAKNLHAQIVGLEKTIDLADIASLWQEFLTSDDLNQQLQQNKFTIAVLYRDFTADFSRAQVAIGYQIDSLLGHAVKPPIGERTQLLGQGFHGETALAATWESIDYQRGVVAVIEQHFYDNGVNTARVDVIYP